jgi:membrane fusion protein (multidrug efflux system)
VAPAAPGAETSAALAAAPAPASDAAPAPASEGRAAAAAPAPSRRPVVLGILALVVLLFAGFGARQWAFARHHVSTDDAQVEGHIIPVLARVGGYVNQVLVNENQSVHAGDVLATLDDRDIRARLAQNEGDLAAAQAMAGSHGNAAAQLSAARAAVAQAEANARKATNDLERYRTLAARGIISRQQLDAAETAASATQAQLQAARDQVQAGSAAEVNADAKVVANRAQRDQTLLQLGYTHILAPHDGVVSKKTIEPGQLVQPGQPVMSVVPMDDIWVDANYKETEIRNLEPGDRAEIRVDSYPGVRFSGKVESLSPATGARFSLLPPDNATGNFTKVVQRVPVRIALDPRQDPAHPLRPGMSVTAVITTR